MSPAPRTLVVIPAFDEAPRIARVVRAVPSWVDAIIVVDDGSVDGTADAAAAVGDARLEVVRHAKNRGVGAAIGTGYRRALARGGPPRDAFVVMAGDGQMDPCNLHALVEPVVQGDADYVKGDRFARRDLARAMPLLRRLGGLAFSWATSAAIGLSISDSQCGYTAIAREACAKLDLDALWPRYGYPNDLLSQLAVRRLRVAQIPVRAVYADEISRLKLRHIPVIAALVARARLRRFSVDRAERAVKDRRDVRKRAVEIE